MSYLQNRPIIRNVVTLQDFQELLATNPGTIIVKFGATWCGPCQRIEAQVYAGFNQMPIHNVLCVIIDIDESPEIYSFMKRKRLMNGVPAIVAYFKETAHYVPDDCVLGANPKEIDMFFSRCHSRAFS